MLPSRSERQPQRAKQWIRRQGRTVTDAATRHRATRPPSRKRIDLDSALKGRLGKALKRMNRHREAQEVRRFGQGIRTEEPQETETLGNRIGIGDLAAADATQKEG